MKQEDVLTDQGFLASELEMAPPNTRETAFFHVIPAPLEATVSYGGGTGRGPAAILAASQQLEVWDGESVPARRGIYTHPAVDCSGEAAKPHIPPPSLERIRDVVADVAACGGFPVLLGGEHTVTYAALAALVARFGRFGVIQFDAHADLRDTYEGTPWSHACVMRRAVADLGLPLIQFGVRALCLEEVEAREQYGVRFHDAAELACGGIPEIPRDFPERVYLSFDVDGLDPSIMPATGTPVPGGLGWYQALELAQMALRGRAALGCDVVELAHVPGLHAADFTAARLTYALMGLVERAFVMGRSSCR